MNSDNNNYIKVFHEVNNAIGGTVSNFNIFLGFIDKYCIGATHLPLIKYDKIVEYKCNNKIIIQFWKYNNVYGIAHNNNILCKSVTSKCYTFPICYYIERDGSCIVFDKNGILDLRQYSINPNLQHSINLYSIRNMLGTNFNMNVDEILLFNLYNVQYTFRSRIKSNLTAQINTNMPFKKEYLDYIEKFKVDHNPNNFTNEMLIRHFANLSAKKDKNINNNNNNNVILK